MSEVLLLLAIVFVVFPALLAVTLIVARVFEAEMLALDAAIWWAFDQVERLAETCRRRMGR